MEIVIRASVLFLLLWGVTRAMGKRTLSEMSAFELLLLVVLGDLIESAVTLDDSSATGAVLAVSTIVLWVLLFSWLALRSRFLRRGIEGTPVVLVHDGRVNDAALRRERISVDDLLGSAREHGIADLADVAYGVLEAEGRISFVLREGSTNLDGGPDEHRTG